MNQEHKQPLALGNHMRNMVGQPYYHRKPSAKRIAEELLSGLASAGNGTVWNPVSTKGGYELIYLQCPGVCGYVWKINIKDKETSNYLVNEINQRRFGSKITFLSSNHKH